MKFRKTFLSKAFKNKFDYESATIEKEVVRNSLDQGRTDIEITDNNGKKFILELKAKWAFPTKEQINMYKRIENFCEISTVTNFKNHKGNEINITWEETAKMLDGRLEFLSARDFLLNIGAMKEDDNYEDADTLLTTSTDKRAILKTDTPVYQFLKNIRHTLFHLQLMKLMEVDIHL